MISNKDLVLQPIDKEDLPFLVKCANDRGLFASRLSKRKTSQYEQAGRLEEIGQSKDYMAMVALGQNGRVGICELIGIDLVHRNCLLNLYFQDRAETVPVWGEKTVRAALNYCFNTLGLERVSTNIAIDDVVMVNLMKSCGFRNEVRRRQHHFSNQTFKAVIEWSILTGECEYV